jgi:glycosyltransferase involved in cell wall biosynthesis
MKLLFLAEPTYPRHQGGAGRGTHLLAAALHRRGHQVRIACECREATEIETIEGVEVHRVNWEAVREIPGRAGEVATAQAMLTHLERNIELREIDVVFDSGAFLSFFYRVGYELKQRYGTAFVLQFRYLIARHIRAVKGAAFNELTASALAFESCVDESSQCFPTRFADEVLCVSNEDAKFVAAALRPASGPWVLPEPVEPLVVDPEAAARRRAELLAPGEQLLFFGGRIDDSMKGGEIVRAAFERILAARPQTRLLLLARDQKWLEPYRRFGSAIIARPWVSDRVELATQLAATDVLLMPSVYEPFGTLCAEALQVGCPVVATNVGGLRDQIVHGENGFLVSGATLDERAQSLAELTLQVLADPALARRLREAGVASAKRYGADLIAERAEAICERAAARARASAAPRSAIAAPTLSTADQRRYLDILGEYVGGDADAAGHATLSRWSETALTRCTNCTRSQLAEDARRLIRLGQRSRGLLGQFRRPSASESLGAVEAACPLGLLQKHGAA